MSEFVVDPVIAGLTQTITDWPLSRLFVFNDSRYHWGLLVPRRPGVVEMCDLSPEDQAQMMKEIVQLSNIIRTLPGVEKLNVGNLGNMVLAAARPCHRPLPGRSGLAGTGLGPFQGGAVGSDAPLMAAVSKS